MLRMGVVLIRAGSSVFWSEKSAMSSVPPRLTPAAVVRVAAGAVVGALAAGLAVAALAATVVGLTGAVVGLTGGAFAAVGGAAWVGAGAAGVAGPQLARANPPAACTVSTRNARRLSLLGMTPPTLGRCITLPAASSSAARMVCQHRQAWLARHSESGSALPYPARARSQVPKASCRLRRKQKRADSTMCGSTTTTRIRANV